MGDLHGKTKMTSAVALLLALAVAWSLILVPSAGAQAHVHTEECRGLICGLEEVNDHFHSADCYRSGPVCGQEHDHTSACFDPADLICGLEESTAHFHREDCFTPKQVLICQLPEEEGHAHGESCYEITRSLVCGLEQTQGHAHTEECYGTQDVLACGLEETEGHTHTEECQVWEEQMACQQAEGETHRHDEECYIRVPRLICGQEESAPHHHEAACYLQQPLLLCTRPEEAAHVHGDECYLEERSLTCPLEETTGHIHTEECYELGKSLTCGLTEPQVHHHTEECYGYLCGLEEQPQEETTVPQSPETLTILGGTAFWEGEQLCIPWQVTLASLPEESRVLEIELTTGDSGCHHVRPSSLALCVADEAGNGLQALAEVEWNLTNPEGFPELQEKHHLTLTLPEPSASWPEEARCLVLTFQTQVCGIPASAGSYGAAARMGEQSTGWQTVSYTMPITSLTHTSREPAATENGGWAIGWETTISIPEGRILTPIHQTLEGEDGACLYFDETVLPQLRYRLGDETVNVDASAYEVHWHPGFRWADAHGGAVLLPQAETEAAGSTYLEITFPAGGFQLPQQVQELTLTLQTLADGAPATFQSTVYVNGTVASAAAATTPARTEETQSTTEPSTQPPVQPEPMSWSVTIGTQTPVAAVHQLLTEGHWFVPDSVSLRYCNGSGGEPELLGQVPQSVYTLTFFHHGQALENDGYQGIADETDSRSRYLRLDFIADPFDSQLLPQGADGMVLTFTTQPQADSDLPVPDILTQVESRVIQPAAASAQELGSLTISYPVEGSVYHLYQVGSLDSGEIVLDEAFRTVDLSDYDAAAAKMAEMIEKNGVVPEFAVATVAQGKAVFRQLPMALYLVVGDPAVLDGMNYWPTPFLLTIPQEDDGGQPVWEVTTEGKKEIDMDIGVSVRWVGDLSIYRPTGVKVQLKKDGKAYGSPVVLNYANLWSYQWKRLPPAKWTVIQEDAPRYTTRITQQGNTYILTNTWKKVPQTGQLWWPVSVMAFAGAVLVCIGLLLRRRSDSHD